MFNTSKKEISIFDTYRQCVKLNYTHLGEFKFTLGPFRLSLF